MFGILNPTWPLAQEPKNWTKGGSFGADRDKGFRHHGAVDLGAPVGTPVIASQDGIITHVQGWDGPNTKALLVHSPNSDLEQDITILYGAVAPDSYPSIGTPVKQGDQIATVGIYPSGSSMLHFELWQGNLPIPRPKWNNETGRPMALLDPTDYLNRARGDFTVKAIEEKPRSLMAPLIIVGLGTLAYFKIRGFK